jgi:serine/threonine protein phosphatase PrpC
MSAPQPQLRTPVDRGADVPPAPPAGGRHHALDETGADADHTQLLTVQPVPGPDDDAVEQANQRTARAAGEAARAAGGAPKTAAPETPPPATAAPRTSASSTAASETAAPEAAAPEATAPETTARDSPAPGSTGPAAPDRSTSVGRPADEGAPKPPPWQGAFVPYSVGDPGRAASIPARPVPDEWDRRDTVIDGLMLLDSERFPLELRAASTRGRAHRAAGTVRQDAYAYRCTPDGRYLVAAVADGVSSGPLSHFAAEVVARTGSQEIVDQLTHRPAAELDWPAVLHELVKGVVGVGRRQLRATLPDVDRLTVQEMARQLASTALFAVVDLHRGASGYDVLTLSIGDTSAWILRAGCVWQPHQPVKNDGAEIASSATAALPILPGSVEPPVPDVLKDGDALVLMTDGIGDPLGDGKGTVGRFLAEKWARPPHPLEFAAQVDFARRSHDDDRTAVAIWPAP